jgi:hypothetical protein
LLRKARFYATLLANSGRRVGSFVEEERANEKKLASVKQRIQQELFHELPASYAERYLALTEIRHVFLQVLAENLQNCLNEHLKSIPEDTLAEKQALATWVNEQLRSLGLAVRCPKTNLPGILTADFKDSANNEVSRFRVEVRNERRGRFKSMAVNTLFDLTLMEDAQRQEALSRGFKTRDHEDRQR